MNVSLKLAMGAVLAMASVGAYAQVAVPTPPYTNLQTPATNNGSVTLTLFSSDDATPFSYSFNLGLNYNDLLASNGMNTPGTSLTWSLTGLAADMAANTRVPTSSLVFDVSAGAAKGSIVTTSGSFRMLTTVAAGVQQSDVAATLN